MTKIKQKNILILLSETGRSIYLESLAIDLRELDQNITIGFLAAEGPLYYTLLQRGFKCVAANINKKPTFLSYPLQIIFWTRIIYKYRIGAIFSHLPWPNLVALSLKLFSFKN